MSHYVYRRAMRYVTGYVQGTTHRHAAHTVRRYVVRDAGRYVGGYVRGTPHRYARHTVRCYVCNIVCRYAVGYVGSNLAQQRVPHVWRQVNGGVRGCVRLYASRPVTGYVWRHRSQLRGG